MGTKVIKLGSRTNILHTARIGMSWKRGLLVYWSRSGGGMCVCVKGGWYYTECISFIAISTIW